MSEKFALSGKLAADEALNAIVWLDFPKTTVDHEKEVDRHTARIRRIEPVGPVGEVPASLVNLANQLQQERTGSTPLDFDLVDVPKKANAEIVKDDE